MVTDSGSAIKRIFPLWIYGMKIFIMKASMQRITTGLILAAAAVVAACSTQPEQRAIDRTCNASDQELTYKSQRALLGAGYKAMQADQLQCAQRLLESARAMDPKDPYALLNLGVLHHRAGRKAEARQAYQGVIDLEKGQTAPQVEKAVVASNDSAISKTPAQIAKSNLDLLR